MTTIALYPLSVYLDTVLLKIGRKSILERVGTEKLPIDGSA